MKIKIDYIIYKRRRIDSNDSVYYLNFVLLQIFLAIYPPFLCTFWMRLEVFCLTDLINLN